MVEPAAVDDHLAPAEIRTGHETDLDVFPHMDIYLLDPVEPVVGLLTFPGGLGSVVACHLEFFYHVRIYLSRVRVLLILYNPDSKLSYYIHTFPEAGTPSQCTFPHYTRFQDTNHWTIFLDYKNPCHSDVWGLHL